jgi:hypothetical protein
MSVDMDNKKMVHAVSNLNMYHPTTVEMPSNFVFSIESCCNTCGNAKRPAGSFTVWSLVWAGYIVKGDLDDCDDYEERLEATTGRTWHAVFRISVSKPNSAGAINMRFDSWIGPSPDSAGTETTSGVGLPIDQSNVVCVPPVEKGEPVYVNIPTVGQTSSDEAFLFPGLTLVVDRADESTVVVAPLCALSVSYMHSRYLYGRMFYTRGHPYQHTPPPPYPLPTYIPSAPPDVAPARSLESDLAARREARRDKRARAE